MAQLQISLTKSVDFQGRVEEFSNVYEYTDVEDTDAAIEALVDRLVAIERPIFNGLTRFVRAKAWRRAGIGPNVMRVTKDLTGTGSLATGGAVYRECAVMLRYPLPSRDTAFLLGTNKIKRVSRYLRKYLHTGFAHGYDLTGGGAGHQPGPTDPLTTYANALLNPLATAKLCGPNGDLPTGGPTFARYLEHRQFPRGRKES